MSVSTEYLRSFIDERPDAGVYRLHRSMFTDEALFELELKHIFEGGWVFVAHESQLPNPFDFITAHIGRHSVIINRDKTGKIQGFMVIFGALPPPPPSFWAVILDEIID